MISDSMSVYMVVEPKVKDSEKYNQYLSQVAVLCLSITVDI